MTIRTEAVRGLIAWVAVLAAALLLWGAGCSSKPEPTQGKPAISAGEAVNVAPLGSKSESPNRAQGLAAEGDKFSGSSQVLLKSCALVKIVSVGGPGLSVSSTDMPMLIAAAEGKQLLWVQIEVKQLDNLPQDIDLQSLKIDDQLGNKHSLVAFGVGDIPPEGIYHEVGYIVSGDGLEAPWMMRQGPVRAQDKYEGAGKVTVSFERGQSAKITITQAPIVLQLVFAFPSLAEQGVIRNILGCSIVVKVNNAEPAQGKGGNR